MPGEVAWAPVGPSKYGISEAAPAPGVAAVSSGLTAVPSPKEGAASAGQPWNPENPLFWFAGIAAVTFGLMAFSTNVRVGNVKAGVSAGTP